MHCVIGSGPSGVACAQALLDRGLTVHMLDAGLQLEPERAERVAAMSRQSPAEWSAADQALIREGMSADTAGVPLKRLFGSDFPYRQAEQLQQMHLSAVGIKPSLARGGLSNVWGAAMLPYGDVDLAEWPFAASRLAEHYRAVTSMTGLSGVVDDLAEWFPLYADRPDNLDMSRQATGLLGHWEARRRPLQAAGLRFGRARLAVVGAGSPDRTGCLHCGSCMYGCPFGLIYNSAGSLERLMAHPKFSYQPGFIVESVGESGAAAVIVGRWPLDGSRMTVACDRVYLAAGVLASTRILLRSSEAYLRPLRMKDSQYFLVPLLLAGGTDRVREERLHTLSQLFLEIRDAAISPYTVHLQAYTYGDLIGEVVRGAFGPLAGGLDRLVRGLEGRLIVLQGYLHSAHSGTIRLELRRDPSGSEPSLDVIGEPAPESRTVIRKVLGRLVRLAPHLGGLPLTPMLRIAEPGRGFHAGGTLPMRTRPGEFETDVLGRPAGWRRLHVVDAAVLPSIAATTITFTVMANAHRIGWESAEL
jgi:choline dehydrogenase-like flavoprotein